MANDVKTEIKLTDNTELWGKEYKKDIRRGLKAIGMTAEKHAKEQLREGHGVDTGLMRNSITFALNGEQANISTYEADKTDSDGVKKRGSYSGTAPNEGDEAVYLGTNVEYAEYQELGSQGRPGLFFLRKAATEHTPEYKKIMKDNLENA